MGIEELTTSIQEMEEMIKSRRKELLEIPGVTKNIVDCIKIMIPIRRDNKLKESFFALDSKHGN